MKVLIAEFPNYFITEDGEVISCYFSKCKPLKPSKNKKGYLGVSLTKDGKHFSRRIHRLVAESFIPNPMRYPCVRHLDGDTENNHFSNLAWGTYQDNENDKLLHGTWFKRITNATVTSQDIRTMRLRFSQGETISSIAKSYSVSRPTVSRIVNKKIWQNV